jgi:putative ABC transport system ATP-binding protein
VSQATDLLDGDAIDDRSGAIRILRRGLRASPELRRGLAVTAGMGLAVAVGRLTVPIIIQLALDTEPRPDGSVDSNAIIRLAVVAFAVVRRRNREARGKRQYGRGRS